MTVFIWDGVRVHLSWTPSKPDKALLFVKRVLADHDNTPPALRKPLSYRDALSKHQCCGGFLFYLRQLEKMAPSADFPAMKEELLSQFDVGYLDPDISHSLESCVPPGDIRSVGAFRTASCFLF